MISSAVAAGKVKIPSEKEDHTASTTMTDPSKGESASTTIPPQESSQEPAIPYYHFDSEAIQLEGDEDPRKWSSVRKWYTTAVISLMGFISPLGSSVIVPGGLLVDFQFELHSRTLSLLTVSFFVLGLGMGPFLLAPASELKGRHPIYLYTSIIFVLLNLGSTLVNNFPGLIVLRFLAGAAGSTGPSLGAGSIGDMFPPRDRGRAQSLYGLGPLLGPVCGTIAGGWLVQRSHSWRWLLGALTILSAFITLVVLVSLRETYGPVLLRRKRRRLAREHLKDLAEREPSNNRDREVWRAHCQEVEKLLSVPRSVSFQRLPPAANRAISLLLPGPELLLRLKFAFSRPFRLLFGNPICAIFSLYMGYIYGIIFLFITQHPLLYQRREDPDDPPPERLPTYGWLEGPASLTYLGLGLGFLTAATINILLQDTIYARLVLSKGRVGWYLFGDKSRITGRIARSQKTDADVCTDEEKAAPNQVCSPDPSTSAAPPYSAMIPQTTSNEKPAAITPSTAQVQGKGRPEYRLPLCLLGMIILPCGLLVFGWTANRRMHWILPLVGSFLVGVGSILPFQSILVYLVDAFIPYSASATACAVLVRCILAAVFPLFAKHLFVQLGFGWGSSLLAFVSLFGVPVPLVLFRYGESLRARFKFDG